MVDGLSGIVEREKKRGHDARMLLEWVLSKGGVSLPKVRPGWLDANVILDGWTLIVFFVGVVGQCLGGWTLKSGIGHDLSG